MITLNLISPEQKAANRFQANYSLLRKTTIILSFSLILIVVLLFLCQTLLQNKLVALTNDIQTLKQQAEEKQFVDLQQSVKDFNQFLAETNKIQSEFTTWTPLFIKTATLVPTEIKLFTFNLNKGTSQFRVTGNAPTREALLSFQKNLESSGIFTEIQSPISNFLSKENINFELTGKFSLVTP